MRARTLPIIMLAATLGCGTQSSPVQGKTDSEVFEWYNAQVQTIPEQNQQWIAEGVDAQTRARRAWAIREQAQADALVMVRNRVGATRRRIRERAKYGDSSFDELVEHGRKRGLEGDAVYEAIIERAAQTRSKGRLHELPKLGQ